MNESEFEEISDNFLRSMEALIDGYNAIAGHKLDYFLAISIDTDRINGDTQKAVVNVRGTMPKEKLKTLTETLLEKDRLLEENQH